METRYSIVGLGKLGASMAGAIASRGYNVIGVDAVETVVNRLNMGIAPVQETGLQDLITAHRSRLRATMDFRDAVLSSDVTFVIVPTPSDDKGAFSLDFAARAFREVGRAIAEKEHYHLVVLTSTVLPGATRYGLLPILEEESGKRCGVDFGLCYSPEFIALGSVIHDFLNPDLTLIGESDERAGTALEETYRQILSNDAPCRRMTFENAELAKISLNSFVTMKISFANMLAELCERLPGGDVDAVSDAIGLDRRVGRRYLTGGLGFGGPCFPRDNVALSYFARSVGAQPLLPEATHLANGRVVERAIDRIAEIAGGNATVGVLGLAYKPLSSVVERSQALEIAQGLADRGLRVAAYDPLANEAAGRELGSSVEILDSRDACIALADIVVIATPDVTFTSLNAADLSMDGRRRTVVDFWRVLDASVAAHPHIDYCAPGRGLALDGEDLLAPLWRAPRDRQSTAA